jgi:hypothetical protein
MLGIILILGLSLIIVIYVEIVARMSFLLQKRFPKIFGTKLRVFGLIYALCLPLGLILTLLIRFYLSYF